MFGLFGKKDYGLCDGRIRVSEDIDTGEEELAGQRCAGLLDVQITVSL